MMRRCSVHFFKFYSFTKRFLQLLSLFFTIKKSRYLNHWGLVEAWTQPSAPVSGFTWRSLAQHPGPTAWCGSLLSAVTRRPCTPREPSPPSGSWPSRLGPSRYDSDLQQWMIIVTGSRLRLFRFIQSETHGVLKPPWMVKSSTGTDEATCPI